MFNWIKKSYSDLSEKNWYATDNNDEFVLRPISKEVKKLLKEEQR